MHISDLISDFAFSNCWWYDVSHLHVALLDISFLSGLHTSTVSEENLLR